MSAKHAVALHGACGRMGREIDALLCSSPDFELAYRADRSLSLRSGPPREGPDLTALHPGDAVGIIDFSSPEGLLDALAAAVRLGIPFVSGTTGIDPSVDAQMRQAAETIPVCWAPNFSIGVPLLVAALREAARHLPAEWQIEIIERHHDGKRDAPSGTALRFSEAWRDERGGREVFGRHGIGTPRTADEVGLHAVRIGGVVGEHAILLGGQSEIIETVHRVQERGAFAAGSIEALRRLLREGPGWFEWGELLCRP